MYEAIYEINGTEEQIAQLMKRVRGEVTDTWGKGNFNFKVSTPDDEDLLTSVCEELGIKSKLV